MQKAVELFLEGEEFAEPLLEDVGEVEESQGVASGSSIEDNDLEFHVLN